MKTTTKLAVACALALAASASQAAVVTDWVYDINMEWVTTGSKAPAFSAGTGSKTVNATTISWGAAVGGWADAYIPATPQPDYSRSSVIINQPQTTGTIGAGQVVDVNMFTHTNNELNANFADLTSATLRVSVDLSTAAGVSVETLTKDFSVYFYETPNVGGACYWGNCSDDILAFVLLPEISDTFTFDGQQYQFNYFQTSGANALTQFSAQTCSLASGGVLTTTCYGFTTAEGQHTTLKFGISVSAVPEPETYMMLLAGLGLIGAVARRRTIL